MVIAGEAGVGVEVGRHARDGGPPRMGWESRYFESAIDTRISRARLMAWSAAETQRPVRPGQ